MSRRAATRKTTSLACILIFLLFFRIRPPLIQTEITRLSHEYIEPRADDGRQQENEPAYGARHAHFKVLEPLIVEIIYERGKAVVYAHAETAARAADRSQPYGNVEHLHAEDKAHNGLIYDDRQQHRNANPRKYGKVARAVDGGGVIHRGIYIFDPRDEYDHRAAYPPERHQHHHPYALAVREQPFLRRKIEQMQDLIDERELAASEDRSHHHGKRDADDHARKIDDRAHNRIEHACPRHRPRDGQPDDEIDRRRQHGIDERIRKRRVKACALYGRSVEQRFEIIQPHEYRRRKHVPIVKGHVERNEQGQERQKTEPRDPRSNEQPADPLSFQ